MKMLGNPTDGSNFNKLVIPCGTTMPRHPIAGEMFNLTMDMQPATNVNPWYPRGIYVFIGNGEAWRKVNDSGRQRRSAPIGAQTLEVDVPWDVKKVLDKPVPKFNEGFELAQVVITPTNTRARFSGTASIWVDHSADCHVILSVWRSSTLVSIVAAKILANTAQSMNISFLDLPQSAQNQTYKLRIDTDTVGMLNVNKCYYYTFEGASNTALTVAEEA